MTVKAKETAVKAVKKQRKPAKSKTADKPAKKFTYPTVKRGEKGELVIQMQALLQEDGSSLKVDGFFGIGTFSAVRAFQRRHGLKVDGIVGPKTWAELLKLT